MFLLSMFLGALWWYLEALAPLVYLRDLPVNQLRTVKPLAKDLFAQPSVLTHSHVMCC